MKKTALLIAFVSLTLMAVAVHAQTKARPSQAGNVAARITIEVDSEGKLLNLEVDGAPATFSREDAEKIKASSFVTARMVLDAMAPSDPFGPDLSISKTCRIINGNVIC